MSWMTPTSIEGKQCFYPPNGRATLNGEGDVCEEVDLETITITLPNNIWWMLPFRSSHMFAGLGVTVLAPRCIAVNPLWKAFTMVARNAFNTPLNTERKNTRNH